MLLLSLHHVRTFMSVYVYPFRPGLVWCSRANNKYIWYTVYQIIHHCLLWLHHHSSMLAKLEFPQQDFSLISRSSYILRPESTISIRYCFITISVQIKSLGWKWRWSLNIPVSILTRFWISILFWVNQTRSFPGRLRSYEVTFYLQNGLILEKFPKSY